MTLLDRGDPVELDTRMTNHLADVASSLSLEHRSIPSGGGHDAMNFQHHGIPTGMLFVPSIDGISHSPEEKTPDGAIRDAAATFAETLLQGIPDAIYR